MTDSTPVKVSPAVYEGLREVQKHTTINPFDSLKIGQVARAWGYQETAAWVEIHPHSYTRGIFYGFEVSNN